MKGIVFTELLELIEKQFGLDTVDEVLIRSKLPSNGVYTAVGTYDFSEVQEIVAHLSEIVSVPAPDLVRTFGKHLFLQFTSMYPDILKNIETSVELLSLVEEFIHVEVRKLYRDAELPALEFRHVEQNTWEMVYKSSRPFADLAHGLIEACLEHYQSPARIIRNDFPVEKGAEARFTIQYQNAISGIESITG